MSRSISLSLRARERIFVNGAVLKVDRKVSLELLNDATFLLEAHVLQEEQATSPVRRLYFIAQAILIDPANAGDARAAYDLFELPLVRARPAQAILSGLEAARDFLNAGKTFDALRILRGLFAVEAAALSEPSNEDAVRVA
ncbi:flagellar biosynthesis repressor FlbT [Methylobacterium sp. 1030]|uniref:flagellar biosynthesis repressor FlbT n=1 Tax=Methylobacterium sp. 1030 TaxID=3156404 RepID=UPI003396DB4F